MTGCRSQKPVADSAAGEEEKSLPPGVTAPPMTASQKKVSDEVTAALNESLIEKAMGEFHAAHDRYPKDHDEFMSAIIEANVIELPDPPPGKRYQYNPERHALGFVDE